MRVRALFALALSAACAAPPDAPIAAEFLVSAGDSAFWVVSDSTKPRIRRAPLWLVRHGERFLEVYATDDDRSHRNAIFIGQRLWARDLVQGDSILLAADTSALRLQRDYARTTPWDPPARPDDEVSDSPSVEAVSDLLPLDLVGPYLGLEVRVDIETADSTKHRHEVRRGVVDLRLGRRVSLPEVVGTRAPGIVAAGEQAWRRARDSVLAEASDAGRAASEALADFPFDPSSFSVVVDRGQPAIAFTIPGQGLRSGGYVLPLAPVRLGTPVWWTPTAREGLPTDSAGSLRWSGDAYDVVAESDSSPDHVRLTVHRAGRRPMSLGRVPRPVRRVWRLDGSRIDAETRTALDRAFNDAGLYGDDVRTAHRMAPTPLLLTARR